MEFLFTWNDVVHRSDVSNERIWADSSLSPVSAGETVIAFPREGAGRSRVLSERRSTPESSVRARLEEGQKSTLRRPPGEGVV